MKYCERFRTLRIWEMSVDKPFQSATAQGINNRFEHGMTTVRANLCYLGRGGFSRDIHDDIGVRPHGGIPVLLVDLGVSSKKQKVLVPYYMVTSR